MAATEHDSQTVLEYAVSVVIPAYRAEQTIARTIESVLAQPSIAPEIIVVVDGVFDKTAEIASQYAGVQVLINGHNRGAQYSRNRGLENATCSYVMFLDADDYIEGPLLSGLAASLEINNADVGFGPFAYESATGGRWDFRQLSDPSGRSIMVEWLQDGRFIAPCAVMWRRQSVRRIGGWDEQIANNQDGEIVLRALMGGLRVATSQEGLGIYWQHDSVHRVTRGRPEDFLKSQEIIGNRTKRWLERQSQPDQTIRRALASFFYGNARTAYFFGLDNYGEAFLAQARALGLHGHPGTLAHKVLTYALGLGLKQRLSASFLAEYFRSATVSRKLR